MGEEQTMSRFGRRWCTFGFCLVLSELLGCDGPISRLSPTLIELERGDTWVSQTVNADDYTVYGVSYVVEVPLDIAWGATPGFSDYLAQSEIVANLEPLDSLNANRQRCLITWLDGTTQEFVLRYAPESYKIDIGVPPESSSLGEMVRGSVRMRSFFSSSTLIEAEIEIKSTALKRLTDVLFPPLGVLGMIEESERHASLRQLWKDITKAHRDRCLERRTVAPTGRVHVISVGTRTLTYGDNWHTLAKLNDIEYPETDAQAFFDWAMRTFPPPASDDFVVRELLLGAAATSSNVGRVLNRLNDPTHVQKGDTVLFFFAGHIKLERERYTSDTTPVPYLVLTNSEPGNLAFTACGRDDVVRYLHASAAAWCVFMLDACYSGGSRVTNSKGKGSTVRPRGSVSPGYQQEKVGIFAAAGEFQKAAERKELKHGIFTFAFLEAVSGAADDDNDNFVTFPELCRYLTKAVDQRSEGHQTPVLQAPQYLKQALRWPVTRNGASP